MGRQVRVQLAILFAATVSARAAEPQLLAPPEEFLISQAAGEYRFELLGESREDFRKIALIRITRLSTGAIQQIPMSDGWLKSTCVEGWTPLEFEDWSLDGDRDLSLYSNASSGPNAVYSRWEFVRKTGQFSVTPLARSMERHEISTVDARTGLYRAYWRSGSENHTSFYRAFRGTLIRVKSIDRGYAKSWQEILPNHDEFDPVQITTFFNRDGSIRRRFYKTFEKL